MSRNVKSSPARKRSSTLYWMRFGLAVLTAFVCALLGLGLWGIPFGASVYIFSAVVGRFFIQPDVSLGRYETYLVGSTTFFAIWFVIWIILYTFMAAS